MQNGSSPEKWLLPLTTQCWRPMEVQHALPSERACSSARVEEPMMRNPGLLGMDGRRLALGNACKQGGLQIRQRKAHIA